MSIFVEAVYEKLMEVPAGKVTTYGELARAVGRPRAVRAVGNALNHNPTLIKIPCHRVVMADGQVGGYAQGQAEKIRLLKKEGVKIEGGKIVEFKKGLFKFL